jgi:hypothetical protein
MDNLFLLGDMEEGKGSILPIPKKPLLFLDPRVKDDKDSHPSPDFS